MKKRLLNNRGEINLITLVFVLAAVMLLSITLVITSVIVKYMLVKHDAKQATKTCAVENMDKLYTSLIEGASYDDTVNYNSSDYTSSFFSVLQNSFSNVTEDSESSGSAASYVIYNQNGQSAFNIDNVQISIAPVVLPMPDAQSTRLVYKVTGTFDEPFSFLSYNGSISIPFTVTGTYEDTA